MTTGAFVFLAAIAGMKIRPAPQAADKTGAESPLNATSTETPALQTSQA